MATSWLGGYGRNGSAGVEIGFVFRGQQYVVPIPGEVQYRSLHPVPRALVAKRQGMGGRQGAKSQLDSRGLTGLGNGPVGRLHDCL